LIDTGVSLKLNHKDGSSITYLAMAYPVATPIVPQWIPIENPHTMDAPFTLIDVEDNGSIKEAIAKILKIPTDSIHFSPNTITMISSAKTAKYITKGIDTKENRERIFL
jgi:hypothetical protein